MKDFFSDLPQQYQEYNELNNDEQDKSIPSFNSSVSIPTSKASEVEIMGIMDITKETIRCFTDYAKCKEHEKTERKRIANTLRAIEYQIDAQKEVYIKELDKQYDERIMLYNMAEKVQEKALSLCDKEMLKLCYNLILNVYNKPISSNHTISSRSF